MIVIFDLDGTVWDSVEGIVGTLEHTLASLDLPVPTRSDLAANVGPPLPTMLAELGVPPHRLEEGTAAYRERYMGWGVYRATPFPGVVEVLDELRADGRRLATATSKGELPTGIMLDHLDLAHRFDVVGAASMTVASEMTKTAVIRRTLARLGDPGPDDCVMVGDRHYDVRGAAEFGIDCIGVAWGYGSEAELRAAGAAEVVGSAGELLDAVRARAGQR